MNEKEIKKLTELYPKWLSETIQRVSSLSTLDGNLQDQLQAYFQLMLHETISTMDEPVRNLLSSWNSFIHTEHQNAISEAILVKLVNEIFGSTAYICKTQIKEKESFTFFDLMMPFLLRSMELAHEIEMNTTLRSKNQVSKPGEDMMNRLQQMQSEFFQLTSETLITPITLIEGYATMIEGQIESFPERNPELEMLVKGMKNGIQRLTSLMDEMTYLALIDQKRLVITKQPISINQFLQKVDRDYKSTLAKRSLNLSFQINNTDQIIHVDVEKLMFAMKILLHYAISTTQDEGKLEIITDTIQDKLQIQIIDNGYGLSTQQKSELFNKLKKAEPGQQTARKFSNISGNGLYIVKGIIQNHLGSLWVDSPIYENLDLAGKRFNILVPIK
jgi:signal transduction histidine kinase